ncbi:MAG: polysaccharide biosynthesis protein [Micrococcales bacterium]|nr:polysaccharide biosynthesis protein [Micrococcales bacterium]
METAEYPSGRAQVNGTDPTIGVSRLSARWAVLDVACWALAVVVAEVLRYDLEVSRISLLPTAILIGVVMVVWLCCAWPARLYSRRHVSGSFEEARAVTGAGLACGLVVGVPVLLIGSEHGIPRSTLLMTFPLAVVLMLCLRYLRRLVSEQRHLKQVDRDPAVIYGAGFLGGVLVRHVTGDNQSPYRPVALLDDDPSKAKARIGNVSVMGALDDLPAVAAKTGAKALLVAIAAADAELMQRVANVADKTGIVVKVVPPLDRILTGAARQIDLRDLSIEDVVGRRPVKIDVEQTSGYLSSQRVLVTGAGGSIGRELCAQINRFGPSQLIMLDRDETALQGVDMDLHGNGLLNTPATVLLDIRDETALTEVFEHYRPQVVFHAAALKHLPMLQRFPEEAWKTNVLGTLNVLKAAHVVGVEVFVNVSTDKAADPTSVLGQSKLQAERLTAWMAKQNGGVYLSVRFGNVLGSRGSMLPVFNKMIEKGGPVTVTDPEATRYFMTIPEACQLVLQAGGIGRAGEVLVLDMGEPVKIDDIARRMIDLSGRDIDIVYTGLRPGEKLHETLISRDESAARPFHPLISHTPAEPLSPTALEARPWPVSAPAPGTPLPAASKSAR